MKTIVVLGAIFEKDGKILLARRAAGRSMAGMWEFPGGKLEPGETDKECLKREIMEEMKADIEVLDLYAESRHKAGIDEIHLKCYRTKLLSENMQLSDHDKVIWAAPGEILSYDLAPADRPIAKKLAGE